MFRLITRQISHLFSTSLNFCIPFGHFAVRLWLAKIFLAAGLLKISSWVTTVYLFSFEYHVPLLPPEIAAGLSTFIELVWPVLLVFGFGGRFMYVVFFVYNLVAMLSYPVLLTPDGYVGLQQHINWGLLIMMLMFYGSGKISIDYYIQKHWHNREKTDATRRIRQK